MGWCVPVTGCDPVFGLALVSPSNTVGTSVRWPSSVSLRLLYSRARPQRNGRATRVIKPFFSFLVGILWKRHSSPIARPTLDLTFFGFRFTLTRLSVPVLVAHPFCRCSAACYGLLRLGMPEMLKPTSLIIGAGLSLDVACLTDGRFSGGYVDPFLLPSHTLVAGLRAYPVPTFFHVLSEHRKLHLILCLSFLFSLSFAEARHYGTHAICGIGPSLPFSFIRPSIQSEVHSISAGR